MKLKKRILSFILFPMMLSAQDLSTYQNRKAWVLDQTKDIELLESGKHGMPKALARLHHDPRDQSALTYVANVLENRHQYMFDFPGVALALCRYRDSFTPFQLKKIQRSLERLAKEDKIDGEGFLGHGTENHATIMWASAFLFGEVFPDAQWANGMNSRELMDDMKERMRKTFKNYYDHGYAEYLSTTYELSMNYPIEILLECVRDPEMKAIAEAYMLYKWSVISLNLFEGTTIAPFARMNTEQDHLPKHKYVTAAPYSNWLLWGWGTATDNMKLIDFKTRINDFTSSSDISFMLYTALSNVVPDDIFLKLGNLKEPFSMKSTTATFGLYGSGASHAMMRKVYRNRHYAIGSGNFRWVPGGDYSDFDINAFNIVWSSPRRFNYITCFHPYWYSDGDTPDHTPDTWYKGANSPFQQTAHHKNAVVMLFDIPEKDPWPPNRPNPERWGWRDGHTSNLIQRAQLRYPENMDEQLEEGGWIFLREGKTYIGIKPLKTCHTHPVDPGNGFNKMEGFTIVKSEHAKTGFIFEAGSEEEHGSFDQFRKKLLKNKVTVNWDKMTVNYTTSKNDKIQMQYVSGLTVADVPEDRRPEHWPRHNITGLSESIPVVTINGKREIPYRQWPMIESPFVNMNNSILKIDDGQTKITVDWQGRLPIISRNNNSNY